MTSTPDLTSAAADRLEQAAFNHIPTPPVRELLGATDVAAAYAVQDEVSRRRRARGGVVVGRKIGLTSPAVQRQLGVDQPDFGVLFADMAYADGAEVPMSSLLQPKVEPLPSSSPLCCPTLCRHSHRQNADPVEPATKTLAKPAASRTFGSLAKPAVIG